MAACSCVLFVLLPYCQRANLGIVDRLVLPCFRTNPNHLGHDAEDLCWRIKLALTLSRFGRKMPHQVLLTQVKTRSRLCRAQKGVSPFLPILRTLSSVTLIQNLFSPFNPYASEMQRKGKGRIFKLSRSGRTFRGLSP